MMKIFEKKSRSLDQTLPQEEFVYNNTVRGSKDIQEEVQLKIEKTNKMYKTTAEKKRREKFFEEEDMMMVYLRRERIPTKSVPTEQLNPDWNLRTSFFEEGGTDAGRELRQQVNYEPQLSTTNISYRQPNFTIDRQFSTGFCREFSHYNPVDRPAQLSEACCITWYLS